MDGMQGWCCVTPKAKGSEASNLFLVWGCYHAVRKPKLPTCLGVYAGCWLGDKGKHPEKKSQSKAVLSCALEGTRVISVPCLNS